MATPALIVTQANGNTPTTDGIFAGLSFFLVQRLPSRSSFVNKIQSNGGRVVKLEAQADHIIADHIKPVNCPPGSISYTFIDKALEDGSLPNVKAHSAGAPTGLVRPVASGQPRKGTRTPFTADDDRELYLWVKRHEARGARIRGNDLYQRFEEVNPRHPFQAWRDRYIKKLHDNPPPGVDVEAVVNGEQDAEASEADQPTQGRGKQKNGGKAKSPTKASKAPDKDEAFTDDDVERLVAMGGDIENIDPEKITEAWESFAKSSRHSADDWRKLWEDVARPEYAKRQEAEQGKEVGESDTLKERLNGTADTEEQEAEQDQGALTINRPSSSSSLKRKRGTPTPRKHATYGRKKQKEGHEMFSEADSGDEELLTSRPATALPSAPQPNGTALTSPGQRNKPSDPAAPREPASKGNVENSGSQKEAGSQSSALPTSDANRAAAMQLDDDYQRLLAEETPHASQQQDGIGDAGRDDVDENALAISDANRAAAMQLDSDFEALRAETTPIASQASNMMSQTDDPLDQESDAAEANGINGTTALLTSDLNRAADHQLRRESLSSDASQADVPTSDLTHFPETRKLDAQGRSAQDYQLHSEGLASQIDDDDPSALVQSQGNALTEANLATQDEQHRDPLVRGTDLPRDDEMEDQSDFVQYLQNLQSGITGAAKSGFVLGAEDGMVSGLARQEDGTVGIDNNAAEGTDVRVLEHQSPDEMNLDYLPISSQQELDQIMTETLKWPESPTTARANQPPQPKSQEPSAQFETQVQYPLLPRHTHQYGSISPMQPEEVGYPKLPSAAAQSKAMSREELEARFDRDVLGIGIGNHAAGEDDNDVVNDVDEEEALAGGSRGGVEEDDITLHVPEPEDGFGFSSSQPQLSQQQDAYASQHDALHDNLDLVLREPEGESGFSSSPPRSSQQTQVHRSPVEAAAAAQLLANKAMDEQHAAAKTARAEAIEITSSSSSSSSEADPASPRAEPEHEEERALDSQELSSSSAVDPKSPRAEAEADDDEDEIPFDYTRALNTQDIYTAETQAPDFSMPLPDSDDEESASSAPNSSPHFPSSPTTRPPATTTTTHPTLSDSQPLTNPQTLNDYIDRLVLAYNHPEHAVIAALKCTSMRPDLAELVLLEGKAGKGLPGDVPGVWSAEEDRVVEGGDAGGLRVLEEKHGWREVVGRLEWLREWREDGDGEEGEEGKGKE